MFLLAYIPVTKTKPKEKCLLSILYCKNVGKLRIFGKNQVGWPLLQRRLQMNRSADLPQASMRSAREGRAAFAQQQRKDGGKHMDRPNLRSGVFFFLTRGE